MDSEYLQLATLHKAVKYLRPIHIQFQTSEIHPHRSIRKSDKILAKNYLNLSGYRINESRSLSISKLNLTDIMHN